MAIEACLTCESIGFSDHYPPSIDYLFAKQVYDDSTQEMLYGHAILQRGWARMQRYALRHAYCQFVAASGIGVYIFSMRGLANDAQNLRIAAIDLGLRSWSWTGCSGWAR